MQIYPTAGVLCFNGGILSVGAGSNLQVHPFPASRSSQDSNVLKGGPLGGQEGITSSRYLINVPKISLVLNPSQAYRKVQITLQFVGSITE